MNHPIRLKLGLVGCLALAAPLACSDGVSTGGTFRLAGHGVGGGGTSVGGTFRLSGAVAQPASRASTGGTFRLAGGIYGVFGSPSSIPSMSAVLVGSNAARLSWPDDGVIYILEFSSRVGSDESWAPVVPQPVGNTFETPCAQPARFFRLRRD